MVSNSKQIENNNLIQLLSELPSVIGKTESKLKELAGNPIKTENTDSGRILSYRSDNKVISFLFNNGTIKTISATESLKSQSIATLTYKNLIVQYELLGFKKLTHTIIYTLMRKGAITLGISFARNETGFLIQTSLVKK